VTQFIRFADTFRLAPTSAFKATDKLPAGTYAVKIDKEGYFLQLIADFNLPDKLYGDCTKNAERIITTFWDRPNSTGVFLEGEKGSGKTLLIKAISLKLLDEGVPTLVINEPHFGEAFNQFIQSIDQPAAVLFDEFEKIYSNNDEITGVNAQERVLTLFDGVYPTKKLFMVTANDSWRIDKNMKNRPGRMYYMLNFRGLDDSFIREYANENLLDKTQIDSIVSVSTLFGSFNFDMLKALVEEMNRYGETAQESIQILNTKPNSDQGEFDMQLFREDKEVKLMNGYNKFKGNPLNSDINVYTFTDDMRREKQSNFMQTDLQKVDGATGSFMFVNAKKEKLILTRKKYEVVDWTKFVA
jgi:hypothetical protein